MPGVYLEFIKAGKFVVPVELTFQTETIKAPGDIHGLVSTSKWIERHNWKEIKAMLKPAVEACLKYNDTPLDNIPKSHHISYGREVSLGYLIVPNKVSTPFLSILDPSKNCWTDDEDDEDELMGIRDNDDLVDHGAEFTECIPTKTAIRVCVVRKSVVSIDDARRIRKELGVRSDDVRNYFSTGTHLSNEPGPSSLALNQFPENFDKEKLVSEWAANSMYMNLRDSGNNGMIPSQPPNSQPNSSANLFNSIQQDDREVQPANEQVPTPMVDGSSDSEVENIPRTFGDLEEIRDAARVYTHVLNNREVDSGEDPDDDLSLPDIEPNPPKKKKGPRSRKKSASLSPSKSKRLTHNNVLAVSQDGQANFSEEDTMYGKKGSKKSKRKRTVAVVEPMRTLVNGQVSFEQAIGALGLEKRRKARPGSSHGTDKVHTGGGRSKQTPAIDIIAPDDDRLTITTPPEPIPGVTPSTSNSNSSPTKDAERDSESEKRKQRSKKKRRKINIDDDPHKWERLTPSPLFDDDDRSSEDNNIDRLYSSDSDSDPEMPILIKMVESDEEKKENENNEEKKEQSVEKPSDITPKKTETGGEKSEEEKPVLDKHIKPTNESSPDITQIKVNAAQRKKQNEKKTFVKKLGLSWNGRKTSSDIDSPKSSQPATITVFKESPPPKPSTSKEAVAQTQMEQKSRMESESVKTQALEEGKTKERSESPKTGSRSPVRLKLSNASITHAVAVIAKEIVKRPITNGKIEMRDVDEQEKTGKVKRKRKLKRMKKKLPTSVKSKSKERPQMGDAQTQTDDLFIVADIERKRTTLTPNVLTDNNTVIKISRSCEVSSDEEFCDMSSQHSKTPVPDAGHAPSKSSFYHPALGSPNRDYFEDEGLFSFESPTIPVRSSSQTSLHQLSSYESESSRSPTKQPDQEQVELMQEQDHVDEDEEVEEIEADDENHIELNRQEESGNAQVQIVEEILSRPESPQPGCSHWAIPTSRSLTPPPTLTSSILMPPPLARPLKTPRKLLGSTKKEEPPPPRLPISSPEHMFHPHSDDVLDSEEESMPMGAEALDVSNKGKIYHVLNQPDVFNTGMKLIEKVQRKPSSANSIGRKLMLKESESENETDESRALVPYSPKVPRKRNVSPDICPVKVPEKRLRALPSSRMSRIDAFRQGGSSRRNSDSDGNGDSLYNALVLRKEKETDDEVSDIEGSNQAAVEYFQAKGHSSEYEPQGDEFDLSQRSFCMLNVISQYGEKSRLYKIHAKNVRDTPIKAIIQHFNALRPELLNIFEGKIRTKRHELYNSKNSGSNKLGAYLATPFVIDQIRTLSQLMLDSFIPDKTKRPLFTQYLLFVVQPEALIRIFARINGISNEQAETEMTYGACYTGEVPKEYCTSPAPSNAPSLD